MEYRYSIKLATRHRDSSVFETMKWLPIYISLYGYFCIGNHFEFKQLIFNLLFNYIDMNFSSYRYF